MAEISKEFYIELNRVAQDSKCWSQFMRENSSSTDLLKQFSDNFLVFLRQILAENAVCQPLEPIISAPDDSFCKKSECNNDASGKPINSPSNLQNSPATTKTKRIKPTLVTDSPLKTVEGNLSAVRCSSNDATNEAMVRPIVRRSNEVEACIQRAPLTEINVETDNSVGSETHNRISSLAKVYVDILRLGLFGDFFEDIKISFGFLAIKSFSLDKISHKSIFKTAPECRLFGSLCLSSVAVLFRYFPRQTRLSFRKVAQFFKINYDENNSFFLSSNCIPSPKASLKHRTPANSNFSIAFSLASDSKLSFASQSQVAAFENQQKVRDQFFAMLRAFIGENALLNRNGFDLKGPEFAKQSKQIMERCLAVNLRWFMGVFVEEYYKISCSFSHRSSSNAATDDAAFLAGTKMSKIKKLESRFFIPSTEFGGLFEISEEFFVRFIALNSSVELVGFLLEILFDKLMALFVQFLKESLLFEDLISAARSICKYFAFLSLNPMVCVYVVRLLLNLKAFSLQNSCVTLFVFVVHMYAASICTLKKPNECIPEALSLLMENFPSPSADSSAKNLFYCMLLRSETIKKLRRCKSTTEYTESTGSLVGFFNAQNPDICSQMRNTSENLKFRPDFCESLLGDDFLLQFFSAFQRLYNLASLCVITSDVDSLKSSTFKSPSRKIRPLTQPLQSASTSSEPTKESKETDQHLQSEMRKWFLWKYPKISEAIETLSRFAVDGLFETFVHSQAINQIQPQKNAVLDNLDFQKASDVVLGGCKKIFKVYFDEVLALYDQSVQSVAVGLSLEKSEALFVEKFNALQFAIENARKEDQKSHDSTTPIKNVAAVSKSVSDETPDHNVFLM